MGVDALLTSAASGMRARIESLEMLANNIANQSSPGFKVDREAYSQYIAEEALDPGGTTPEPPVVPLIERHWTDFSQGALTATGNPYHLALSGRGFFTVQSPDGPAYTRNGAFRLTPNGGLETSDGFAVLDVGGQPVRLDPSQAIEFRENGDIFQGGQRLTALGLAGFDQTEQLAKREGTYFQWGGPAAGTAAARPSVHSGRLESSNGSPAESAVRLVSVLRQFEMLQKSIQIGSEMGKRSEEVARIGD